MIRFASIAAFILFIGYGVASHFLPDLPLAATVPLALACAFAAMASMGRRWWIAALAGVAAVIALVRFDPPWLVYLPPVLMNGAIALVFFASLRPGRVSVIERIIALIHGAEQPRFRGYARGLTLLWGLLLAGIALTCGLLAAFAPHQWWSIFANLLAFLIMVVFSVAEYFFRRHRFPDHETANPLRIAALVKERGIAALGQHKP